jgi:hypothetical protein
VGPRGVGGEKAWAAGGLSRRQSLPAIDEKAAAGSSGARVLVDSRGLVRLILFTARLWAGDGGLYHDP